MHFTPWLKIPPSKERTVNGYTFQKRKENANVGSFHSYIKHLGRHRWRNAVTVDQEADLSFTLKGF